MSKASRERERRGITRRAFVGAGAAAGAALGFPHIARAAGPLRTVGLAGTVVPEIQARASQDLGFDVRGRALGYAAMFAAMRDRNDSYDVAEGHFNDAAALAPARVWRPIDTERLAEWDKVTDLCKTGRLTPDSNPGQGDAPFRHLWLDADGNPAAGPSRWISMVPAWHNADSMGYNPERTGRAIDSWADLLSGEFAGRAMLIRVPQVGAMEAALAVEALGVHRFGDKGNMTRAEIDLLAEFLIARKRAGHFAGFWETEAESAELMLSGGAALGSMWSPGIAAVRAAGMPCVQASPREGMRGWHGGLAISARAEGERLDRAYAYIDWQLSGWAGAFFARRGYYMSIPENVRAHLDADEWDYWYEGKPAARDLPDPFGAVAVRRGEVRDGGSYRDRFRNIAVWNSAMDENAYLEARWSEFLAA